MPSNAKKHVYKEKEFGIYVLWKFLPAHFRGMKKNELMTLGITDPTISKIVKIKSQTEFAKCFHIKDLGTLTDWNDKIKKENITSPLLMTDFYKQCSDINQRVILPNITELKEKVSKQNKIISSLKKENTLLKKKLMLRVPNKKANITNAHVTAVPEMVTITKPEEVISEHKNIKTIFQKIFRRFSN